MARHAGLALSKVALTLSSISFDSAALGSIERNKLNVDGSSLGLGHPFAATGKAGRTLISMCATGASASPRLSKIERRYGQYRFIADRPHRLIDSSS